MSASLRRWHRLHGGSGSPLLAIQAFVRERGPVADPAAVSELARRAALPEAAVRAALSYYADLHADSRALRACRGTSCVLGGADANTTALAASPAWRPIACAGYCDRSPVVLTPADEVLVRCRTDAAGQIAGTRVHGNAAAGEIASSMPRVECVAPEPVVTGRLLASGASGDASSLDVARAAGVYDALETALRQPGAEVLAAVERSGHRGRGGAAFAVGAKWRACAQAPGPVRWVVANGDEGDPGSFVDRVLMERDPHSVLAGMLLCAHAVGASRGIVYIRSEYPQAIDSMQHAIEAARAAGILGLSVLGSGLSFDASVFPGMGSYVCGEETAMLEAIEGFRGEVRLRPPYPAVEGLFGEPTVVNNVETLAAVPWIVARGPEAFRALGTAPSPGTKVLCLNHGFARPGIVEVEMGRSLREVIEVLAGGSCDGAPLAAVLIGGPMGSIVTPDRWDVPVCYAAMSERGIQLGHGGIVALPEDTDFGALLRHLLEFMASESCGRCVPCRIGSQRALEVARDAARPGAEATLDRLFDVMSEASLCAFGQLMPGPMRELTSLFGDRIFPTGTS